MKPTGRLLAGPGASLVEIVDDGDLKHMAVVFDTVYRDHPSLNSDLQAHLGFMEQPDVTGLGRLVAHEPGQGAFVYPTGTVWSIAEVVRELAAEGEAGGVKAGLELCFLAAEILVEASDKEVESGLTGHGSVDPWRLALKADGQVVVLGYGLPRPEIEVFLDDETRVPSEDGLRYCAPETLGAEPYSDIGSDLFSLTLVALELMVGRPVYDGLVEDIRQKAGRGEAVRKLYQWRDRLVEPVREVLGKALKPDPDARYRDGLDFVYSVHDLLGGIDSGDGPSLRELVTRVRARQKRGRAVVGGNTGALSRTELAELAADIDATGVPTRIPEPRQPRPDGSDGEDEDGEKPRWRRATRNAGEPAANPRRGRRRGRRASSADDAPTESASSSSSARERLLARLRGRDGDSGPSPRRRRRPGSDDALPDRPRRRGRRRGADPDDEEETRVENADDVRAALRARRPPSRADDDPSDDADEEADTPDSDEERTEVHDPEAVSVATAASEGTEEDDDEAPSRRERSGRRRRSGGRAAALLERLRSSSGGHAPEDQAESSPRAARQRGAPGPLPKPAAPPLPEEASEEPQASGDEALESRAEEPDFSETGTLVPDRTDEPVKPVSLSPTDGDGGASVEVTYQGRTVEVPRDPTTTGAGVREAALDALGLVETDLLGHTVAWHRLVGDAGAIALDQPVSDASLTLERVENTLRAVRFEVRGASDSTRRVVETVTATAVPVVRLKRVVGAMLGTLLDSAEGGGVDLLVDGTVLADHAVLADVSTENAGPLHVEVRR
jgi:hypothetical protein